MQNEISTLNLSEVFLSLDSGGTVEEIQEKIREVSNTLGFARNGGDESKQLIVKDAIGVTMPKRPKPATLFYATNDGSLTRQNPDQPLLGMGIPR